MQLLRLDVAIAAAASPNPLSAALLVFAIAGATALVRLLRRCYFAASDTVVADAPSGIT
jgi:hypothetical protein